MGDEKYFFEKRKWLMDIHLLLIQNNDLLFIFYFFEMVRFGKLSNLKLTIWHAWASRSLTFKKKKLTIWQHCFRNINVTKRSWTKNELLLYYRTQKGNAYKKNNSKYVKIICVIYILLEISHEALAIISLLFINLC